MALTFTCDLVMIPAVIFFLAMLTSVEVVVTSNDMSYYDPSPLTAHDASAYIDKSTTLRCQLKTGAHNRGWYVITWQRINVDGNRTSLVNLPFRQKIPEWSKEIPPSLQSRIQPVITVQPNHVEFNLLIRNVSCADEGQFRCIAITPQGEIISTAELNVVAEPTKPDIINKYIPKMEHGMITLECKANTGLPPRMLLWYYKEQGAAYFSILNDQNDIVEETDGCLVLSTRTADVIISAQSRGTRFRCGYRGYIEKPGLYDEIAYSHEETAPQMGEVRVEPKPASSCEGPMCQNDGNSSQDNQKPNGGATSSMTCTNQALYLLFTSFYVTHFLIGLFGSCDH